MSSKKIIFPKIKYPLESAKLFDLSIKVPESNLVELKMFNESETLGLLLVRIFLEEKTLIQSASFRMSHPFATDLTTKTRIGFILISFYETKSEKDYKFILRNIIHKWMATTFEPTFTNLGLVGAKKS